MWSCMHTKMVRSAIKISMCVAGMIALLALFLTFRIGANERSLFSDSSVHVRAKWSGTVGEEASMTFEPLTSKDINGVQKFVFIGYPRSGHSIIGSMMDAHPNMIIAHDFRLYAKLDNQLQKKSKNKALLFNALYRDSLADAYATVGLSTAQKDHTLGLISMWQGRFKELKVIGDKSGGRTTIVYNRSPIAFIRHYRQLAEIVKVPIHVIHVVRNPYDMIATHTLYLARMHGQATPTERLDNQTLLKQSKEFFFDHFAGVQMLKRRLGTSKLLEVHIEDFIRDPKNIIRGICSYLDLECPTEYVQGCYDKAFKTVSRSRDQVVWDPATLALVNEKIKKYPFFHGYSFQEDFPK